MEWIDYVGEIFSDDHGKKFHAEAYDETHGFCLRNRDDIKDRSVVQPAELMRFYHMIIELTPYQIHSLNSEKSGSELLDRVIFNLEAGMSALEVKQVMLGLGYQEYDVYLAIKGAEMIVKSRPPSVADPT